MTISIIGLGKLGASMTAAIASKGFNVIGVDNNQQTIDLVNAGHAPVQETNLEETVADNSLRIRATKDYTDAIMNSDLSFVIVPTPSNPNGSFSLEYVSEVFYQIGEVLKNKNEYHNIVLASTVLPGATRFGLLPILEKVSSKKCGNHFGLCYSPEFIALGSIIQDFLNPDFTLIGEFDKRCGGYLEKFYSEIMENNSPCKRMSLENAELTKVALNTYVTTKITYANMLADLCERIPGGNVDIVTDALGADTRIGNKYLKGALGYGGPCFPRDNLALGYFANAIGSESGIAEVTDQMNRLLPSRIVHQLMPMITKETTVAILGLAYKPHSQVTEESQAMSLLQALNRIDVRVVGYDPLVEGYNSLKYCLKRANIVLITNPDPVFKSLTVEDFLPNTTVIDFWRILDQELSNKLRINYIPVGRCINDKQYTKQLAKIWNQ